MLQLNMRVDSNARKCSSPRICVCVQRGGISMRIADDGHLGDLNTSGLLFFEFLARP